MTSIDRSWVEDHPLPLPAGKVDKNSRGRVLIVGGSTSVPGALLLSGGAAFRAGAGKVILATAATTAIPLGVRFPEAAVQALPTNDEGELAASGGARVVELADRADTLVVGPGMGESADAAKLLEALGDAALALPLLIDAGMIRALGTAEASFRSHAGPRVLTPHPGEMAALMDCDESDCGPELAEAAAARFDATIVLKSSESWVATPDATTLHYAGGGPGLATGGSGDVLAGIIAALLARGIEPQVAAAWGVWLHGEAGRRLAVEIGTIGFLARELLPQIPGLMRCG